MVYEVGAKWNGDMDRDQVAVINRRILVNMPLTRPHNDLKPKKIFTFIMQQYEPINLHDLLIWQNLPSVSFRIYRLLF
ncbi:hypothetical protein DP190_18780 [Enterobacter cloacae]|jgi:hypothetical protein|nr:hypothetical protein DP190_18780 [Enterobacter cloacae]